MYNCGDSHYIILEVNEPIVYYYVIRHLSMHCVVHSIVLNCTAEKK